MEQTNRGDVQKGSDIYEECIAEVPFDPVVISFRLLIEKSELTIVDNKEGDRLCTVIMALSGYFDQIGRDRALISNHCKSISREEFLSYLSIKSANYPLILTYLLVGELKERLKALIGEEKVLSISGWGSLQIEFIE